MLYAGRGHGKVVTFRGERFHPINSLNYDQGQGLKVAPKNVSTYSPQSTSEKLEPSM